MGSSIRYLGLVMLTAALPLAAQAAPPSRYGMEVLTELSCDQAVARLNEGLDAKDVEAMHAGGQMYDEGWCVKRDATRMAQLWRAAADAGHSPSAAALALKIGQGDGVAQDYAAAGELLKKAGLKVGEADFPDAYSFGYAYTWLRTTQRELRSSKELASSGAQGLADVEFDTKRGAAQVVTFRRTDGGEAPVGTRIDRSRSVVRLALTAAAEAAVAKLSKPDPSRLADVRFKEQFAIAPGADYESRDLGSRIGPAGILMRTGPVFRN